MVWENLIFTDQNTDSLFEWGGFKTKFVSKIEADQVGDYTKCRKVLAELGMPDVSGWNFYEFYECILQGLFTRFQDFEEQSL